MRSIEFCTYLLPGANGALLPSSRKLTWWQALAHPGALPVEASREVRQCPESAQERCELGFSSVPAAAPRPALPPRRAHRRRR
jgi:hypothetical protein